MTRFSNKKLADLICLIYSGMIQNDETNGIKRKTVLISHEPIPLAIMAKAYKMPASSLLKAILPFKKEMQELGDFDIRNPAFNQKQTKLLYKKIKRT